MTDKIRVSGSAVSTAGTCGRKALYSFHPAYHLEPVSFGPALTRGLIGHKALEVYYTHLMNGMDTAKASKDVLDRLMTKSLAAMNDGDMYMSKMISDLLTRLREYFDYYVSELDDYDIIGVEVLVEGELPNSDNATFAGRVDLVVRWKRGQWRGEVMPLDHKFVYNFWNENVFIMNAQMPNYIWALRKMFPNETIARAIVNQVRHRENATERFRRDDMTPTRKEVNELILNHGRAATEWAKIQAAPVEEARKMVYRNPSKFACQYCPFIRLCKAELMEEDTSIMLKTEFRPNTYGYADRDDEQ